MVKLLKVATISTPILKIRKVPLLLVIVTPLPPLMVRFLLIISSPEVNETVVTPEKTIMSPLDADEMALLKLPVPVLLPLVTVTVAPNELVSPPQKITNNKICCWINLKLKRPEIHELMEILSLKKNVFVGGKVKYFKLNFIRIVDLFLE